MVLVGPEYEVEVVGHEAEGEDAEGVAELGLMEGVEEGEVVGGFLEEGELV